jgi:ABC-type uncharacterized transport system substrate-binding protein
MYRWIFITLLSLATFPIGCGKDTEPQKTPGKKPVSAPEQPQATKETVKIEPNKIWKIFIVSSYHREYLWSQDTNQGVCAALLHFDYLDHEKQAEEYTKNDYVKTSKAEIKKAWMDAKRKSKSSERAQAATRVSKEINDFKPDALLLGDDDASEYLGRVYLDETLPVVFWGINGVPLKYGLLDSLEKPGHNVTGIYQSGYLIENLQYLIKVAPKIKNFAVLSDDSSTGRSKAKEIQKFANEGMFPIPLVDVVMTDSEAEWKAKALELAKKVDAFFMVNHNTIKSAQGEPLDQLELGAWYLRNIKKPECAHGGSQFVIEGMLLVVDDSGYKQGYEAVRVANSILKDGKKPGEIAVYAPARGPVIVNRERAKMLGISITPDMGIEEYIDTCLALEKFPK